MNRTRFLALLVCLAIALFSVGHPSAASRPLAYVPSTAGALLGNGGSTVTAVAPGTSGNLLTSNGSTWTSASPPGWITALDCDFTALSSVDPLCGTSNWCTSVSMCGYNWTVKNPASSRGNIKTTSGSGLILQTHTGGTYFLDGGGSDNVSAPQVFLPLSALGLTGVDYDTKFRVWLDVSSQPCNDGSFGVAFGLFPNVGANPLDFNSPGGTYGFLSYRSSSSATQTTALTRFRSGVANAFGSFTTITGMNSCWVTANETTMIETGPLVGAHVAGTYPVGYVGTAWSSGWPTTLAPTTVNTTAAVSGDSDQGVGWLAHSTNFGTAPTAITSRLGIVIAGFNSNGGSTARDFTIARVRLDYRR